MGDVVICKKHILSNLRTIVIIRIMIIITIIAIITTYIKRILESIKAIVLTHEERASVGLPGVVLGVPLPDKCVNICRGRQSWLKYVNSEHCDAFYNTILLWWSHSNTARRKNIMGRGLCVFVNWVWGFMSNMQAMTNMAVHWETCIYWEFRVKSPTVAQFSHSLQQWRHCHTSGLGHCIPAVDETCS